MSPSDCVPSLRAHYLGGMAEWAEERPIRHGWKGRTCRDLWAASPRGDWLLGYAEKAGADRRDVVRAVAACVRPALRFVPEGEDRPRLAVEAAERWADEPTEKNREKVWRAGNEAWASAGAAATWAAWRAAGAHLDAEGPESEAAAHLACADAVRRLVPFLDLPARGGVR